MSRNTDLRETIRKKFEKIAKEKGEKIVRVRMENIDPKIIKLLKRLKKFEEQGRKSKIIVKACA